MSKLTCKEVSKTYGKQEVLSDIHLTLESGKIYGLIGRNGAGKTTLLSILTAQNPATTGEVLLDHEPVWENHKALDQLCFSRDLSTLQGNSGGTLKVKEYLNIAATYYPYWDQEMADRLIGEFGVDKKKRISKLSKGMLSMVTIVVAMASKAKFTFLDEPVSGLDVVAREEFYQILLEEYTNTNRTFLVSTHIIEEAADVFEEVIILKEGKLLLKENTQDLLERACRVSGRSEEVDRAVAGLEVYHREQTGRSKGVTVLLKPGQRIGTEYDVMIQPMSLQKVFASLCGKEEK